MLSNNERTPQVVRQAMLKLGLEGRPEEFSLAQMLPDKGKYKNTRLVVIKAHLNYVTDTFQLLLLLYLLNINIAP